MIPVRNIPFITVPGKHYERPTLASLMIIIAKLVQQFLYNSFQVKLFATLRELVDSGSACLRRGDHAAFRELMNRNFEIRAKLFPISKANREMVEIGRSFGAGVKLCGSGGAVVGALANGGEFSEIERAYGSAGYRVIRPEVHSPQEDPGAA